MIFQELKINIKIAFFARVEGGKMMVNIKQRRDYDSAIYTP